MSLSDCGARGLPSLSVITGYCEEKEETWSLLRVNTMTTLQRHRVNAASCELGKLESRDGQTNGISGPGHKMDGCLERRESRDSDQGED